MRAYTTPMLVSGIGQPDQQCHALEALPLQPSTSAAAHYDERWVQMLIRDHPTVLPVGQIEPALVPLESVCVELPLPNGGYVDNLLMTREGGIVLVETKLWRNSEARRAVVGQVLDYAKELSRLTYADLERAVAAATKSATLRLYDHVCGTDSAEENEPSFIDAVTRNLRLGRFLVLIVGDGIQEGVEQLAEFLQRHIGLHFTLGLVELSLWKAPTTDQILVQPRILASTVQIERAVIRIEQGPSDRDRVHVEPAAPNATQRSTVTTEQFYESLGAVDSSLPGSLKAFLGQVNQQLGVYAEHKVMLTLKWRSPDGREFNLGVIDPHGRLFTDQTHSMAASIGKLGANQDYKRALAAIIPGAKVEGAPEKAMGLRLVTGSGSGALRSLLDSPAEWSRVIGDYIAVLEQQDI